MPKRDYSIVPYTKKDIAPNGSAQLQPTVVSLFLGSCDVPTLVRLLSTNKTLSALVQQFIKQSGHVLLPRAVCATATGGRQHKQALEWLLCTAKYPQNVLDSSAATLLNISFVGYEVAEKLAAAGLRYSWSDIAAAASRCVAGVETWVAAGAVEGAIPELARAICHHAHEVNQILWFFDSHHYTQREMGLEVLQPSDLPSVLHLAVNMKYLSPAEHILTVLSAPLDKIPSEHVSVEQLQRLQHKITPQLLQQLLQTACLRGTADAIAPIAEFDADIPGEVIMSHLQQAVQQQEYDTVEALFAFPPARSIGPGQLVELLQQALQNRDDLTAQQLLTGGDLLEHSLPLSARSLLTTQATYELASAALQHLPGPGESRAFRELLKLPAAQNLDSAAVAQLLQLAMRNITPSNRELRSTEPYQLAAWHPILKLLRLPAAAGIAADSMAALVELTLEQGCYYRAKLLLQQEAAHNMQAHHLVKLLQILLQNRPDYRTAKWNSVKAIGRLPAVAEISTEDVLQLLRGQAGNAGVLQWLLGLPGSRSLDTATLSQLLLFHHSRPEVMQQLLDLPAAQLLESATVQMLLDATLFAAQTLPVGAPITSEDCVKMLCQLPGAARLDAERVIALVQMTLQEGRLVNAYSLLLRLAAGCSGTPSAASVVNILTTVVVEPDNGDMPTVVMLCQGLPGATSITSSQIADLVSKALKLRHDEHVTSLLRLPGAKVLEPGQIGQLLRLAMQAGHVGDPPSVIVSKLCTLPGASDISPRAVQPLLRFAVQQQGTFRHQLDEPLDLLCNREPSSKEKTRQAGWDAVLSQLCKLPAAAGHKKGSIRLFLQLHLQPAGVAELLQTAIQLTNPAAVISLCELPGAAKIDAVTAAELLVAAAEHGLCRSRWQLLQPVAVKAVEVLLRLPAVQQIGLESTKRILQLAVEHKHVRLGTDCKEYCCPMFLGALGLPAGRRLSSSDTTQLVALAGRHGTIAAMQVLQAR